MGKVFIYGMGGLISLGLLYALIIGGAISVRWAAKLLFDLYNKEK